MICFSTMWEKKGEEATSVCVNKQGGMLMMLNYGFWIMNYQQGMCVALRNGKIVTLFWIEFKIRRAKQ